MKYLKYASFLLFILTLFLAGCSKLKNEPNVEFKFVLLDTLGNEKTVFNQGENIVFSFQIINNSSEDLFLKNFFSNDEFFRVYESNIFHRDFGIPYEAVILIGYFTILKNDTLKIEYPWQGGVFWNEKYPILSNGNINDDLPTGNFYTEFTQSFEIGGIETEEKYFKINFTVK